VVIVARRLALVGVVRNVAIPVAGVVVASAVRPRFVRAVLAVTSERLFAVSKFREAAPVSEAVIVVPEITGVAG